ncbi:hypothetical protein DFJ77DRAFT_256759 [Powellomyces hirtus]|nr:hypothetical protein DFJ77DRAFT_256759 [Powellomyces hirtus]
MAWLPIITCACVASIVLADNVDKLATFYKLFDTLCGSLAFSLLIHSVGFLYSGYKLTNAMNVGKMLQAHASGSSKANLSSVAREQPKRKKSGLTVTVRNLMIAVVVGWTLLAIDLILNWALTLQSAFGFWNFVYYDLNVAWIAAASYLAMSAGMMETVMITQQTTSKGKRSGAEVSGKAINASQRSLGNGAEDVLEVA